MKWLAGLTLVLTTTGCVKLDYFMINRYEPIVQEDTARLAAERADLQACLDQLGAPHLVWETDQGLALSYAWLDKIYWQVEVEVGYTGTRADGQTVFSYDQTNDAYDGAVLVFDDTLRLRFVRHGKLGDITRDLRRRPRLIE